jgi:hypothetical protein
VSQAITEIAEGAPERKRQVDLIQQFIPGEQGVELPPGISKTHLHRGPGSPEFHPGAGALQREKRPGGNEGVSGVGKIQASAAQDGEPGLTPEHFRE